MPRGPILLSGLLSMLPGAVASQNFDAVEVRVERLAPGVAMLVGAGGNIGVSYGSDGVFLVDDQYAPLSAKILAAVRTLSTEPIRFVINTHWHGDHTGGNEAMGQAGALLVAHDNVRSRMSTEQFNQLWQRSTPAASPGSLPVVTFSQSVTFHLNGDVLDARHVANAHTDGDAIIWFRGADVVHMGDTFFLDRYPFIDVDAGGSIHGVIAAADAVLAGIRETTRIIPGHGAVAGRGDLQRYRDVLVAVRDRVTPLVRQGWTVERLIAEKPLAEFDGTWGGGFINPETWLRILHRDLSSSR